jgi:hypothetical protein
VTGWDCHPLVWHLPFLLAGEERNEKEGRKEGGKERKKKKRKKN